LKTLLIDGQWLIKKNYHKRKNIEISGDNYGASYGFLDSLRSVLLKVNPDRVVVMWDGFNSGKLRYEIYKPYKSNRKKQWDKELDVIISEGINSKEDREMIDILNQKFIIKNFLEELFIRHIEVDYIESDDLIAYYILKSDIPDEDIIIYSRDKDFLQLVDNNVSVLTPDNFEMITIDNFREKYGYTIENALLFKCFEGDSSDKIGGVKGVTIRNLLENFPTMANQKYYYDDLVRECYSKKEKSKKKLFDKIIQARGVLYRNAKLINLKSPFVNDGAKKEMENIIYGKFDCKNFSTMSAINLFIKKKFHTFAKNEDTGLFFAPFFAIVNKEKLYSNK
jgi:DNA polymerase I